MRHRLSLCSGGAFGILERVLHLIQFLIRRFVKGWENPTDQGVRARYGTLGAITGMMLNLMLAALKMVLGWVSGSVAMTADGVNNLSDAGGSLMALIATRMAQKPLDEEHPFGHGRLEYVGAMIVGVLIAVFGIEMLQSGIESIVAPRAMEVSPLVLALLVVGMLIKLWMWKFNRDIGEKTDNQSMLAASKDSLSDVMATGAVFLATILYLAFGWMIDGYVGMVVSLLVLKSAYEVLRDTVTRLLGGKPDRELGTKIIQKLMSYEGILGVHDFVLHDYGPGRSMASVHAEISADSDLVEIHEVIDTAEREISEEMGIPICIHMDPILTGDEATERVREQISEYLSSLTPPLKLHDFRRVPGENNINLVFDVLLPPDQTELTALRDGICAYARTLDGRYRCVIHFDRDYFTYAAE